MSVYAKLHVLSVCLNPPFRFRCAFCVDCRAELLIVPVEVQSKDVPLNDFAISDTFQIIRVDHEINLKSLSVLGFTSVEFLKNINFVKERLNSHTLSALSLLETQQC